MMKKNMENEIDTGISLELKFPKIRWTILGGIWLQCLVFGVCTFIFISGFP